jgi:aminopeptidase N
VGIRFFLILSVFTFFFGSNLAQGAVPEQRLKISFDLNSNTLSGEAALTLPAGLTVTLYLHDLQVQSLTLDGAAMEVDKTDNSLSLAEAPKDRQVLLSYTKQFPSEDGTSGGGLVSRQGIALFGSWHPTLSADCRYQLTAEVPGNFAAVSEAEEISETSVNGKKRVSFSFPYPLGGINFVAGPYIVEEIDFGDNQRLYSYFFEEDKELAAHYREKALGYLNRYAELIGPYPYRRFSIVENRLPTGYAMPTFTLLGQSVVRLPFIVDTSLGHEIVHAWFGNCVRVAENSGNWAEGLVTYLADHAFARDRGEDITYRKEQLTRYASYVHASNARSVAEFFGAGLGDVLEERTMRAIGYDKASMVFHMLRKQLGDSSFYDGLRVFFSRMQHKRASWKDLQVAFEETSNSSLDNFFEQWVHRSDLPVLAVKNVSIDYPDGIPQLSFTLFQASETPYHLVVSLRLYASEETVEKIVQTDVREKQVHIPLARIPSIMSLDPDYDLMRGLDEKEMAPVWSRFAGAEKKLVVLGVEGEEFWQPLLQQLKELGCEVKMAAETNDNDVAAGSVVFLGVDSPLARSLFAEVKHPASGMTVDIRPHPLNYGQVAVLVSAADSAEVQKAAYKLKHYGKYSYLHFENGRMEDKKISETMQGLRYLIDSPPPGLAVEQASGFDGIIDQLAQSRVIYVGEEHTAYEDHLLQFRIIRTLYERGVNFAIGMEMFSRKAQGALDRFIAGETEEKTFLKEADYFAQWGYDYRLYRDIILYARRHRIPVIGLNIEKDVVSKVYRKGGLAELDEKEKEELPEDRNLDMPGYEERIYRVYSMHGMRGNARGEFKDFFQAQALWDETMAETAANYLQDNPDSHMVILAGGGHVLKENAIPPRLYRRLAVPYCVVVNNIPSDIDERLADYIFFAPAARLEPAPMMGIRMLEKDGKVEIREVTKDSPAEKAGIRTKDILLSLDGEPVADINEIRIAMLDKKRGDTIVARVQRAGFFSKKEIDFAIIL